MNRIREQIREIAGPGRFDTFLCRVKSAEGAACTVTRVMDGMEIAGVRLNAAVAESDGLVITPAADSYVLITGIDGDKWFVSQFSTVEKIALATQDTIEINGGGTVVINGGKNGGLVKVQELRDSLDSLRDFVEAMHQALPAAFNTIGAGTAAAGSAGGTSYTGSMTGKAILIREMENDRVTH